jgi:putative ABC transport system permease protein
MPGAVAQGLVWGLMALGVYITYRLLDFADLTVDGTMATGGAVAVMLIRSGMNPWFALLFAFLAGMAAGLVTGLLHTALGIPGILASILTQISLYSINLNIMGCSNQAVSVDKYNLVVSLRYLSDSSATKVRVFATSILFCLVVVAILYWYFGTEQGHAIRATGCNPQMARAQGINTNFHIVLALMISNGLVGLSGGLYAQYQGAADVNMGRGAIVIGLAAVIIGEVLFGKLCAGKHLAFAYTMLSVVAGAIIYYIVMNLVLWLKLPSDDLKLFSAIVVAIFLAIPYLKGKYGRKEARANG